MLSQNVIPTSTKPKTKRVPLPKGGRLWYTLKFMECVLAVTCLVMLILTQYLHTVDDDFTNVKTENTTETTTATSLTTLLAMTAPQTARHQPATDSIQSNEIPKIVLISKESSDSSNRTRLLIDEHLKSELMNWDTHIRINENLKRVKKVSEKEELGNDINSEAGSISLNDLLIMFPCSTTLLMVTAMEILGEIFKDPLSKLSNLILIFLAILLAITLFTVSLLAYLRSSYVTLILTTIVSAFLIVVELINFILLQLS